MLNEMMHRPVIQAEVLDLIRNHQRPLTGKLKELEEDSHEKGVPIIPHETVAFLQLFLQIIQPTNILEIGTAVGFSSSLMAQYLPAEGKVTTIDRFDIMIKRAKQNFKKLELENKIELLEGQAADILPNLTGPYEFIFLDCAKSKYVEFLPECLRMLPVGGIIMIDDVFQAGTVMKETADIPKKNRSIHRKLNQLFDKVYADDTLSASFVPLGDGILLIRKNK